MRKTIIAIAAAISLFGIRGASAAEICGNGIDEAPTNNYVDEGCFSNWVMGVCPSALSSKRLDVSPEQHP